MIARDAILADVPALELVKAPPVIHADRIADASEGDFRYVVLQIDSAGVVGHACLVFRRPRMWPVEDHEVLYPRVIDLMIRHDHRGRGLGSYLLQQMESICAKSGWTRLHLSVDPEEDADALRFYVRNGYVTRTDEPTWREWSFRDSRGTVHSGAGWDIEMFKDLPLPEGRSCQPEMTAERVLWFLSLFDELGVTV